MLHWRRLLLLLPFYSSLDLVQNNPVEPAPERNIHTLTPIVVINHPLSASSIYYDPWHPPCSICVLDSLFAQSLSTFSLVYLLVWHPPLHTPYISSPNHYLLFAAHVHTIETCFAVVPKLSNPSLSLNFLLGTLPFSLTCTFIWPFSSLLTEVPPHFPF